MAAVEVLEVIAPGLLTTVQDRGRIGFGRFGVAPSGALDSVAVRIGNLLVDNPESEAVLELTLPGFKATTKSDAVVALTGADLGLHINGKPFGPWRAHRLRPGDIEQRLPLLSGAGGWHPGTRGSRQPIHQPHLRIRRPGWPAAAQRGHFKSRFTAAPYPYRGAKVRYEFCPDLSQ